MKNQSNLCAKQMQCQSYFVGFCFVCTDQEDHTGGQSYVSDRCEVCAEAHGPDADHLLCGRRGAHLRGPWRDEPQPVVIAARDLLQALCSCISWNPSRSERHLHNHIVSMKDVLLIVTTVCSALLCSSRAHPPMIAVGSDDSNVTYSGKVQIYEYNENTRYELHSMHQLLFYLLSVISVSKGFMLTLQEVCQSRDIDDMWLTQFMTSPLLLIWGDPSMCWP